MFAPTNVSLGLEYKVTVLDRESRSKKSETQWTHNLILNNTGERFSKGFESSPVPVIGSSGIVPNVAQTGVVSPIPELRVLTTSYDPANTKWGVYAEGSLADVIWSYSYEYINMSNDTKIIREIGIPGFSRSLLDNAQGALSNIPVGPYDIVVVDLKYHHTFQHVSHPLQIVDINGDVLEDLTVSYKFVQPADLTKAVWWKLFSPTNSITLLSSKGDIVVTDFIRTTEITSRGIVYKYQLLSDEEIQWLGVKYSFQSVAPIVEARFSRPIVLPSAQKYELTINPKW